MSTIGTFAKSKDGYTGLITTASFNMQVKLVPVQRESEKSPDFRVLTSTFEFGAAWKKTSQNGREYLSVRLDDPSFASPIFANLVEGDNADDHILIWSRSQRWDRKHRRARIPTAPALLSESKKVHADEQQHQR
jgi:uncharacterized protein (DUF736 family)